MISNLTLGSDKAGLFPVVFGFDRILGKSEEQLP